MDRSTASKTMDILKQMKQKANEFVATAEQQVRLEKKLDGTRDRKGMIKEVKPLKESEVYDLKPSAEVKRAFNSDIDVEAYAGILQVGFNETVEKFELHDLHTEREQDFELWKSQEQQRIANKVVKYTVYYNKCNA